MKILVVEGSRLYQLNWEKIIRAIGQEPVLAASGQEALSLARSIPCDSALIAYTLSDMDGVTCADLLEQSPLNAVHWPLIVTSNPDSWGAALMQHPRYEIVDRQDRHRISTALAERVGILRSPPALPVLYIDDSQVAAQHMKNRFERLGITLHHFFTPGEALLALQKSAYSLVLCDIFIEDTQTGYTLIPKIRAQTLPSGPVPIIMVSGGNDDDQRRRAFIAGADDFWSKSASLEEIQARLQRYALARNSHNLIQRLETRLLSERLLEPQTRLPNARAFRDYGHWRFRAGFEGYTGIQLALFEVLNASVEDEPVWLDLSDPEFVTRIRHWQAGLPPRTFCACLSPRRFGFLSPVEISADHNALHSAWDEIPRTPSESFAHWELRSVQVTVPPGSDFEAQFSTLERELGAIEEESFRLLK
ncbi:MAG: response regulator [Gammaproteobacteria bacterium]